MNKDVYEMYSRLTPEDRRLVDAKIDELLEKQRREERQYETPLRAQEHGV